MENKILLVAEKNKKFQVNSSFLKERGYRVETAKSLSGALAAHKKLSPDVVIAGFVKSLPLLKALKKRDPYLPVIVLTGTDAIGDVVQAMKLGAENCLPETVNTPELVDAIEKALVSVPKDKRFHSAEPTLSAGSVASFDNASEIRELRNFFNLTQEKFARAIGYTGRSVAGWESGAPISHHAIRAIENLRSIKERLEALFKQEEIIRWLHTPNSMFGGKTPTDIMAGGETDRILQVLIRLEEGIHN